MMLLRTRPPTPRTLLTGLRATAVAAVGAIALAVPAAATTTSTQPTTTAPAAPTVLSAHLSGANEVPMPGMTSAGDPDGSGDAAVLFRGGTVDFALSWSKIGAPTRGHIHIGAVGVNGGVEVPFFEKLVPGTTDTYVNQIPDSAAGVTGSVKGVDPALLRSIADNPAGFYVNIHTQDYPAGAVRGQLSTTTSPALGAALGSLGAIQGLGGLPGLTAPGATKAALDDPAALKALAALTAAAPKGTYLASIGDGVQEVSPAGDPDGRLATLFRLHGRSVDYALAWSGIDAPTMAHIHRGAVGVNGPIVVPFFDVPGGLPTTVNGIIGQVRTVDGATVRGLRADAAGYYANVHDEAYPAGAVRGQLLNLNGLL